MRFADRKVLLFSVGQAALLVVVWRFWWGHYVWKGAAGGVLAATLGVVAAGQICWALSTNRVFAFSGSLLVLFVFVYLLGAYQAYGLFGGGPSPGLVRSTDLSFEVRVLSLKASAARRAPLLDQLRRQGVPGVSVHFAVDADERKICSYEALWRTYADVLSLATNASWLVTLEDDAWVFPGFIRRISAIANSFPEATVVWLDTRALLSYNIYSVPKCCTAGMMWRASAIGGVSSDLMENAPRPVDLYWGWTACHAPNISCEAAGAVIERNVESVIQLKHPC